MRVERLASLISQAKVLGPGAVLVIQSTSRFDIGRTGMEELSDLTGGVTVLNLPPGVTVRMLDEEDMAECGWVRAPKEATTPLLERIEQLAESRGVTARPSVDETIELCPHELLPVTCSICSRPPPLGTVTTCRSCRADIVWALTERGAKMPVDANPSEQGNMIVMARRDGIPAMHYVRRDEPELDGKPKYLSHFATCPAAKVHRR